MWRWTLLTTVAVLLTLTTAFAQEDTMSNELPAPAAEMAQLDWFLGEWDVVSRFLGEDGNWVEENLTTEHTAILGGHVIFEHFGGPVFLAPFEAWSLRKYNVNTGKWEQRWVDVTPGGFADWTGTWDEATRTFTGHANRTLNEDGTVMETAVREVFFDITDDAFSWKYERTKDGGQTWTVTWTLDYTRRAAD